MQFPLERQHFPTHKPVVPNPTVPTNNVNHWNSLSSALYVKPPTHTACILQKEILLLTWNSLFVWGFLICLKVKPWDASCKFLDWGLMAFGIAPSTCHRAKVNEGFCMIVCIVCFFTSLQVVPPSGHVCNQCKCRQLVANLQPMQVLYSWTLCRGASLTNQNKQNWNEKGFFLL